MKTIHWITLVLFLAITAVISGTALADKMSEDITTSLDKLYAKSETAKALGDKAKGILVFPRIVKGGFIIGGQYGKGSLLKDGKNSGNYNTIQVSYGLQAGLQTFGYALFFMNTSAMEYLGKSGGWELGVGPTIVVVDAGVAKSMSTTTAQSEIYAVFFDQKGLMAGLGIQGTKITKTD